MEQPKYFGEPRFKFRKTGYGAYSMNKHKGAVRLEGNKVKSPEIKAIIISAEVIVKGKDIIYNNIG